MRRVFDHARPCPSAIAQLRSRSDAWPPKWTGTIAHVFGATPSSGIGIHEEVLVDVHEDRPSAEMHHDVGGGAERDRWHDDFIAGTDAEGMQRDWSPAVQELTAMACGAPTYSANAASKRLTFGPIVIQPERSESTTSAISSSPIDGSAYGRKVGRAALASAELGVMPRSPFGT